MAKSPRKRDTSTAASSGSGTRTAAGHFKKGVSGNPNGRPRKPKPVPGQELVAAMSQVVKRIDGSDVTMAELMALKAVRDGMDDPRLALKLLDFYYRARAQEAPDADDGVSASDEEIIAAALGREGRRHE